MTTLVAFCCAAVVLSAQPALVLTLDGQPLAQAVGVDVLRPAGSPIVAPQQVAENGPPPLSKRQRILIYAGIGAALGCGVLVLSNGNAGESPAFCFVGAGAGALVGVLAGYA